MAKALSLKQPYAWLIANGYLLLDDRTWETHYRGPIFIHASKGLYETYYDYLKTNSNIPLPSKDKLEYGGIVGKANLVLCCKSANLPVNIKSHQKAHFAGLNKDYFGFLFERAKPLPLIPCRGKLGIFEIDIDALLVAPPAGQAELF
jgi:hypothetical protein